MDRQATGLARQSGGRRRRRRARTKSYNPQKTHFAEAAEVHAKMQDRLEKKRVARTRWQVDAQSAAKAISHLRQQEMDRYRASRLLKALQREGRSIVVPSALQLADAFVTLELAGEQPSAALRDLGNVRAKMDKLEAKMQKQAHVRVRKQALTCHPRVA